MRKPPPLPDLATLSDAQKDELIVNLWRTLIATEAAAEPHVTPAQATGADALRARIGGAAPSRRASPPSVHRRPGRGKRLLESPLLMGLLLLVGAGFAVDAAIGWHERRLTEAQDGAADALHRAAFQGLYAELDSVAYEPDGKSYRATMSMQTEGTGEPLYIMLSPVRVFVQTGTTWQEVPASAPDGTAWGVVRLDGGRDYQASFQADVKDWTELIPGYMHVRVESDMLISLSSTPRDDIVERDNRFYVYLKPQNSDDASIKSRTNFAGKPPIFIPMPPH